MSLTRATLASDNTVYAQLILDVGPKAVCETAKLLGITTKLDCYPAEGLGGLTRGVTPLEMANAYATLASGGVRHTPDRRSSGWSFPDGKSEKLGKPKGKRVMTDGQAYEVTQDPRDERPVGHRHRRQLRLPGGGQDRHHRRGQGRLVRGLHAAASRRRSGSATRTPAMRDARTRRAAPTPPRSGTPSCSPAHGDYCDDFPLPDRARSSPRPFFGKYSSTGSGGHRRVRLRRRRRPYTDGTGGRPAPTAARLRPERSTRRRPRRRPTSSAARRRTAPRHRAGGDGRHAGRR